MSSHILLSTASYCMMDLQKRKRDGDDDDDAEKEMANKKKTTEPEGDDEEVEEFFAILRRIRAAVKYFERADGSGRRLTPKAWEPSFEAGDFEGDGDRKAGVQNLTADSPGLDLNSEHLSSRGSDSTSSD